MNKSHTNKKLYLMSIVLLFLVLINVVYIMAARFDWNPIPNTTFYLTQGQNWSYDVDVTCDESFVNFSMEETPFPNLTIKKNNGLMTFTPTNDDVGKSPGPYLIIVRNITEADDALYKNIYFNITNTNDPPNITSWKPNTPPYNINENSSQNFNITATDPDLSYGDYLYYKWFSNGNLQTVQQNGTLTNWTFLPTFCQSGSYTVIVSVNDTSNEYVSRNWSVSVIDVNRPPVFNISMNISNKTWSEDVNLTNNISLMLHFYDYDNLECNGTNNNTLTFSYTISNGNITVVIDNTSNNVSFYPVAHWQGNASVTFTVNDGKGGTTYSNIVYLNVTGVPDAPVLHLNNVSWVPSVPYQRQVNATDPDIPYGDSLNFSYTVLDVFPEFSMNKSGYINFTPITFGNHSINITVTDSYGLNDTQTLLFMVRSNSTPVLYSIPNQKVNESSLFGINVSGYDVDGDSFNISSNFTAFNYSNINATMTRFFFTPNQSHVGNHSILFIINDSFGATNTTVMNLEVTNINNAPELSPIGSQIAKINRTFTLYVNASDMDGDSLNFSDNATFFNITTLNSTTGIGLINFTYNGTPGNFSVLINVTDNITVDYEIVPFELTYNRNPVINPIGIQNGTTGVYFALNISGSDPDRDDINFTTNVSKILVTKINRTHATLSFVPIVSDIGIRNISITVSDGDGGNTTTSFLLNVTYMNHAPFFMTLSNVSCNINISCWFNITGYDIDGAELNFSVIPAIFNRTNVNVTQNSTTAQFNFTPWEFSVGNYTIKINISDGNLTNSSNITVFVNRYPIINWTSPYYNESQNIKEGYSIAFNITAYDVDGNNLTYYWFMNQTFEANYSNWTFFANYTSQGFYNITVFVSDGALNSSVSWNLTINNSNRAPEFGIIRKTTESDFSNGNLSQVNITVQSGSIVLARNESNYYQNGLYISNIISIPKEYWANVSLTNISWITTVPSGTNISVQTMGSHNLSFWDEWSSPYSNANGSQIINYDKRYIQYMINFSTNDTNVTPVLEEVQIHYLIPNFTGTTGYYYWLDLSNYFSDQDGQSLNYSGSPVENIDVLIYSDGQVELRPNPVNWYGTRTITFNATDGENTTFSNEITIVLTPPIGIPSPTPVVTTVSGGGGSTIKTVTTMMNVTEQIYLDLIAPGPVKIMPNQTISVPIIIRNKGTKALAGIKLSYKINASTNVSIKFKDTYFNQLLPSEQKQTDLIIKSGHLAGTYSLTLIAEVTEPYAYDSAIVHIEILDNFTEQVNAVRDLIKQYPECLELNEVLLKAEEAIRNYDYTRAGLLLDSAVEGCKYLISSSGKILELQKATRISQIDTRIVAGVIFVIVMLLLIIYYLAITRNSQKPF